MEEHTTSADGSKIRPLNFVWATIAIGWLAMLCFVLDPTPLSAPAWAIALVRSALGSTEPVARVITALAIRVVGIGVLGILVMLASGARGFTRRSLLSMGLAIVLGVGAVWVSYGYFPILPQVKLIVISAICGTLAGLVLRRSWKAGAALVALLGLLYVQFTGYDMDDDLAAATRAQAKQLLATAPTLPDGDAGFLRLTEQAFAFAAERSKGSDPVIQNKAAVLALAVLLGHEKLADLAERNIDRSKLPACDSLRNQLSIHERHDWVRHFCVSAGLTLLEHDDRSMAIGILKEMKDANPGGSGFSFGDLTADAAGNRFALAATRDMEAAVAMQERVRRGLMITDLFPDVHDLPEGLTAEEFRTRYGGVGGALSDSLVNVITQRLDGCAALR